MNRTIIQKVILTIFLGVCASITHTMENQLSPDTTAYYDFIGQVTRYFSENNFPMIADTQKLLLDTDELQILYGYCAAQDNNKAYFLQQMYSAPQEYRNAMRAAYSHYLDLVKQYPQPPALNDDGIDLDVDEEDIWSPSDAPRPLLPSKPPPSLLPEDSPPPRRFNPLSFHIDATDDEIFITISENVNQ
jgi:hypothetical protein